MKIRNGFVSNSSSASFVVKINGPVKLTQEQVDAVLQFNEKGYYDSWTIHNHEDEIHGWTVMDNGDLGEYFNKIGLPTENYTIEDTS